MDLRAQDQSRSSPSPGGGAADVLSTAASTVRDVLSTPDQPETTAKVKTIANRLPRSAHAPLYEAVHSAAEAADMIREDPGAFARRKEQLLKATTDYVDASPLKSVGIAFAAGWLIGRITR
jgi:ElaB/YqjD/DUF883 family membrane-anchored ribosome-binding protein